jgi:hypothetical protein
LCCARNCHRDHSIEYLKPRQFTCVCGKNCSCKHPAITLKLDQIIMEKKEEEEDSTTSISIILERFIFK